MSAPGPSLPATVCFRVTRHCNARCGFCLAPPDGGRSPDAPTLTHRLDWLRAHGVKTIHFCGGEPTIHPALGQLLAHVHERGGKNKLTTNGILLPDGLLPILRATATRVKLSLHGDRPRHDAAVGCEAFDAATDNLRRLLAAGVPTSIQTTITADGPATVDWMVRFCLELGVRRLTILPLIPRGRAATGLGGPALERRGLQAHVLGWRRSLAGRLDVRWQDFSTRPVPVVEPDGRVVLERATEAMDTLLCSIPPRNAAPAR
jgi:MoaA/NifB/PqqE/SkfB family radical SAM enzyme